MCPISTLLFRTARWIAKGQKIRAPEVTQDFARLLDAVI
jgi:hypothetical protein